MSLTVSGEEGASLQSVMGRALHELISKFPVFSQVSARKTLQTEGVSSRLSLAFYSH